MDKIVIIGANQYQDPLICKAKSMGLETHVFAWQIGDPGEYTSDYFYPISVKNREFIYRECQRIRPSAVVTAASDLAMCTVGHIAAAMGLPCNSERSIELTTNKLAMRKALKRSGLPQPNFVEISDELPIEQIQKLQFPVVVKPSDRSGGRGVVVVKSEAELLNAIAEAREISFESKAIVEEYIAGTYYSAEAISYQGKHHILAFTHSEVFQQNGRFFAIEHRQPSNLSGDLRQEAAALIYKILDALEVTIGASHTEFVIDGSGKVSIIEASGSMGGDFIGSDLTPLSTGMDYLRMVIDVACGRQPDFSMGSEAKEARIRFLMSNSDKKSMELCCRACPETLIRRELTQNQELPLHPDKRRFGYYITAQRPREMGGYLPLELSRGREYFRILPAERIRRLNSGRTAIWWAVQELKAGRIFVPRLCSPAILRAIEEAGAQPVFYSIDENLLPGEEFVTGPQDAILLINYYGLLDALLEQYVKTHQRIILDHAGAFFCPPIIREDVYNIYSCRKFTGVPDGGYLVGEKLSNRELDRDYSAKRSLHLLHALEVGTDGAYQMSLSNERELKEKHLMMSELTYRILDGIDYERIKAVRRSNYNYLEKSLREHNQLHLELRHCVPQYYPFAASKNLREQLIQRRIYLPMQWRRCLTEELKGSIEYYYAEQVCCLPVDQRYDEADMEYLVHTVLDLLG